MKIALLVYNSFENDARVEKALDTYAAAGHEVRVVCLAPPRGEAPASPPEVLRVRLRPGRTLTGRALKALWFPLRGAASAVQLWLRWGGGGTRGLYRFARRIDGYRRFALAASRALQAAGFRPDLVHANDFNTLPAAELLHERWKMPFIYDSHELWSERNRGDAFVHPIERRWELETERRVARKAARVIAVSRSIALHLAPLLGIREPEVIRNVPYASARGTPGLRQALRLPASTKLVLYTGKATFNRGLEEAIEALALVPEDIHLVVLGSIEPRFKPLLDRRAEEKGLRGRVHHHGPVPSAEVPLWASEADLCLVPIKGVCLSYEYCLPNKLFEGIQAGLPILATDLVEMKRTLDEYRCGLTYRSGDTADLGRKIRHILWSPGIAQELRRQASAAARALNWEAERGRLVGIVDALRAAG
jgi:glycosyltransferase involved in cell wall biosynthesis